MKRKFELGVWLFLALVGMGLIVANIIHYTQYGSPASAPATLGGALLLLFSLYEFIYIKSKKPQDNSKTEKKGDLDSLH